VISAFLELASELRRDLFSSKMVPALSAGLTSGLGLVVAQVAFGSLIFFGPLEAYSSQGIGLILFGNFAACLVMALTSSYRGTIAGLSPALIVIMATIASSIETSEETLFVTAASALIISAVATGLCCLMIGHFRLARLMRFIPYPVAAGFLSGIGGAVCLAGLSLMGAEGQWWPDAINLNSPKFWILFPGVTYGILLYYAIKRWGHALILPVSTVILVGAYHIVLGTLGITGSEARGIDLLLTSTADGQLWPSILPADIVHVEWAAIMTQIPHLLTLTLIAFISIILNVAGLELAVNREMDWNKEFKSTGYASMIAGIGGGTVATIVVSGSMRSKLLRAGTRLTGVIASIVIGAVLIFGDKVLEIIPTALIGGILIFAGWGLLDHGLIQNYKRLPVIEFGVILAIFLTIVFAGLIEGVGAGMLIMLVFFAVRLSRVDPIESQFTAHERHSNKARTVPERTILLQEGGRVKVFQLRGYIFFGSIGALMNQLKEALKERPQPICLVLNFSAVSGLDFSAINELSRFLQTAIKNDVKFILSGVSEQLRSALKRTVVASTFCDLIFEANENSALERCEDIVLMAWRRKAASARGRRTVLLEDAADSLESYLERQIHFEALMEQLHEWLTPRKYAAGDSLPDGDELQLLISGRVSAYDSSGKRLHQFSPGSAIRSAVALGKQSSSIIADTACRTMVITADTQNWLEKNKKELTLKLYRYLLAGHFEIHTTTTSETSESNSNSSDQSS
jgi:SulP family sulfate permease